MANSTSTVVELCPSAPDRVAKYFTELFVSGTFKIPPQKPDKEEVVNIQHNIDLVDVQTINVTLPDGTTGRKVFVGGNIYLDVQYVSTRATQTVHFVRFQLPFQTILLDDCGNVIPNDDTIFPDNYVVHVCLEKLNEKQLDERTLFFEALLLVWLEEI